MFSAVCLGTLFDGLDASIFVLVLQPALSEILHTTEPGQIAPAGAAIIAALMFGYTTGGAFFGALADRIGRARSMILTILLYSLTTGLCATAHSVFELIVYRFLVGCGIGGEVSTGTVFLSEHWKGRRRIFATGAMTSMFASGYFLASLLNLGLGHLGWRALFVVGILPALLTVYIRARLKEPPQFEQMKARTLSAEAKRPGMALLLQRLFDKDHLQKTLIAGAFSTTALVAYWAILSWIPAWINQITGSEAIAERSAAAMVMNAGVICGSLLAPFLIDRIGRVWLLRIGFAGAMVAAVTMFATVTEFGATLLCLDYLIGFFSALPFTVLCIFIPELYETQVRGTAFGLIYNFGRIFAAFAALAGGQLIGWLGGSYAIAALATAPIYILGLVASLFMPQTSGEVSPE